MTRDQLEAYGRLLYGGEWQTPLARDLDVGDRTVRRWAAGDSPVPAGVAGELVALLEKHRARLDTAIAELRPATRS